MRRSIVMILMLLAGCGGYDNRVDGSCEACNDATDADTDADSDSDTDADTDSDTDADSDADTDPGNNGGGGSACSRSDADLCIDLNTPGGVEYARVWGHVEFVQSGFDEMVDECNWLNWSVSDVWDDVDGIKWELEPGFNLDGVRISATYCPDYYSDEPYGEDGIEKGCTWLAFGVDGDPAQFVGSVDVWYLGDEYSEDLYTVPDGCPAGPGSDAIVDL